MAKQQYISKDQAQDLEQLLSEYAGECKAIRTTLGKHMARLDDLPPVPTTIAQYIDLIIKKVRFKPNYINYSDALLADMLSNAQFDILGSLRYYDPTKAGKAGAFGFISGNCIQSFNSTILQYKRELADSPIDQDLTVITDDAIIVKYIDHDLADIQVDSKYKKYLKAERLPQLPEQVEQRIIIERNIAHYVGKADKLGITWEDYLLGVKAGRYLIHTSRDVPDGYQHMWGQYRTPYQLKQYKAIAKAKAKKLIS